MFIRRIRLVLLTRMMKMTHFLNQTKKNQEEGLALMWSVIGKALVSRLKDIDSRKGGDIGFFITLAPKVL